MKMRQLILATPLLLVAGGSVSLAQDSNRPLVAVSQPAGPSNSMVLERAPIPQIGDIWTYKLGAYRQVVWTYLGPNGDLHCYSVKLLPGGADNTVCKTSDDNFTQPSSARPNLIFPLYVGKEWEYSWQRRPMQASHMPHHMSGYAQTHVKVTAYEPVTVGAGTFDAFKIESTTITWGETQVRFLTTIYYSPKLGVIKRDYNTAGDENYSTEIHLDLLSYTRNAAAGAR